MPAIERSTLPNLTPEDLLTSKEVAEILHISPRSLERYRSAKSGLLYIDLNHKIKLYPKILFYQWMVSHVRKSTSDSGEMAAQISEALEQSSIFMLPPPSVTEAPKRKRGRPKASPPASLSQQLVLE
jgi:hypothetical protein